MIISNDSNEHFSAVLTVDEFPIFRVLDEEDFEVIERFGKEGPHPHKEPS